MLSKYHGFSLIEFIIIILIIGILAVMPIYQWPGTDISLNAQVKLFANDIRYTQFLAMSKTERYRIVRTSATTYQIQNSSGNPAIFPSGSTTAFLNTGFSFIAWSNLPSNLIAFDGRGTPYIDSAIPGTAFSPGTSYSVTISDGTSTQTISISPITGRVAA